MSIFSNIFVDHLTDPFYGVTTGADECGIASNVTFGGDPDVTFGGDPDVTFGVE